MVTKYSKGYKNIWAWISKISTHDICALPPQSCTLPSSTNVPNFMTIWWHLEILQQHKNNNRLMALCPGLRGWAGSIASSLFKLRAWQSFCTTSLHVLFGLHLGLQTSTSYFICLEILRHVISKVHCSHGLPIGTNINLQSTRMESENNSLSSTTFSFYLLFPWHLVNSMIFPWQMSNSLAFPVFQICGHPVKRKYVTNLETIPLSISKIYAQHNLTTSIRQVHEC